MTKRKPADMSFRSWIDAQIEAARQEGLFDDLPGAGRPQASLREAEDPLWWAKSLVRRENLEAVPPALEIRRKVERFRLALPAYRSEAALREAVALLNDEIRALNRTTVSGPPTSQAVLDPTEVPQSWREALAGQAAKSDLEEA
jgi:hypothetical protein